MTTVEELMAQLISQHTSAADAFNAPKQEAKFKFDIEGEIIRPHRQKGGLKEQEMLSIQPLLDALCLPGGGVPTGSTITLSGPPGVGKTRTAMEALVRVAYRGIKCVLVAAEEGFIDEKAGRNDMRSRILELAMAIHNLTEEEVKKQVEPNYVVIQAQYHRGQTWSDFVKTYKYLIDNEGIEFAIIDSLTGLDPQTRQTTQNLAALKTWNHSKGVTALVIGQTTNTQDPVGGRPTMHTADVVFHLEYMDLGSKDKAKAWGVENGGRGDKITVMKVLKSNTTKVIGYPVRVQLGKYGTLSWHKDDPNYEEYLDGRKPVLEEVEPESRPATRVETLALAHMAGAGIHQPIEKKDEKEGMKYDF